MPITFACPICKTSYTVNDLDAGKKSDCKVCGQRLQVPAPPRVKTVLGELNSVESEPDSPPFFEMHRDAPAREVAPASTEPYPSPRTDRLPQRPGKAQAIAFMVLLGGAWAILWAIGMVVLSSCSCVAWPGTYYSIVFGILAIIRGAELMGSGRGARRSPRTVLIMQIIAIVNADVVNLACGIVGFVFLNDPAVERFYGPEETNQ